MLTIFVQGIIVALAIYVIWRLLSAPLPGRRNQMTWSALPLG